MSGMTLSSRTGRPLPPWAVSPRSKIARPAIVAADRRRAGRGRVLDLAAIEANGVRRPGRLLLGGSGVFACARLRRMLLRGSLPTVAALSEVEGPSAGRRGDEKYES